MRRLTICLLAATWLFISPTANAVEFKVDDSGATPIHGNARQVAPSPRSASGTPPTASSATRRPERIAQVPTDIQPFVEDSTGGDVFQSPVDALPEGNIHQGSVSLPESAAETFTIDDDTMPQVDGTEIQERPSDLNEFAEGEVTEISSDGSAKGPSCTRSIDTSHVHWKGGDMFTCDEGCTEGCSSCGDSAGGGLLGGCSSGGCTEPGCTEPGCTECGSGGHGGLFNGGLFNGGLFKGGGCCNRCNHGGKWFLNGWISQGYTYNTDDPASGFNTPLTFNDRDEEWLVNQVYLKMGRNVRDCGCCWDWGGRVDLLFGSDYFFTQSIGLETRRDGSPRWNSSNGPRSTGASIYGLALPQAYLEFYSPWLRGVNVKLGHFYTTVGYESVMAPENFFYSHAYTMQYGEPFTHTGVLSSFNLGRNLKGHFGVTRGWDTWEDPNGTPGYLTGISWTPNDVASLAFTLHTGSEDSAGANDRTVYSLVYTRQINRALRYVFQHDFGSEANGEFDADGNTDSAKWYGINQYLFLDINSRLTAGIRAEWFRDQDNARVLAIPQESLVDGGNYAQVSLGLNARIRDTFVFRPEVRWDWSDVSVPGISSGMFNDFTESDQFTIAADLIFQF